MNGDLGGLGSYDSYATPGEEATEVAGDLRLQGSETLAMQRRDSEETHFAGGVATPLAKMSFASES